MRPNIKISNIKEAPYIHNSWSTHTISLLDPEMLSVFPDSKWQKKNNTQHIIRYFDDIGKIQNIPKSKHPPTRQIVEDILEFTKSTNQNSNILIHCHAGISRSPAITIAILLQSGLQINEAIKFTHSIRPSMSPNAILIRFIDDIFYLRGQLCIAMHNWAHSDGHVWDSYIT
jgi:predicted protein tyrosine phosphatase